MYGYGPEMFEGHYLGCFLYRGSFLDFSLERGLNFGTTKSTIYRLKSTSSTKYSILLRQLCQEIIDFFNGIFPSENDFLTRKLKNFNNLFFYEKQKTHGLLKTRP